jgi:acetylornithine aminotransferase
VAVLDTVPLRDGKCIFLSSGSEAVEFGVQVARRITGKPLLLTLSDSYLAAYGSAGRKSPEEWHCFDWSVCTACPHADGCDPQCSYLREIPFPNIGGLVFEPGNTAGLIRFPPHQLIQALVGCIKAQLGLVVVDEVTTGLARTGLWYGHQHYDLQPDITAMGKGLGNGYPVSAVVMTDDVAAGLENAGFRYAQSHQNDPLACAIAAKVVTVIRQERLVERSHRIGTQFAQQLTHLAERHDMVREVRGRGLMIAMEFKGGDGPSLVKSIYSELLERGFIVGCKPEADLLRFYPPLTIGEEDIAGLLENLDDVLTATK